MKCYVTAKNLSTKTREWLKQIEPFNLHSTKLKTGKSALLVIDMQNIFLDPSAPLFTCGGLAIIPQLKQLIEKFRAAKRPVIYTCHVHHPDFIDGGLTAKWWPKVPIEGLPESEIHKELAPKKGEKIVYKHRYSAFYNTDLETVLRSSGIEDLVIAGVMTNVCCESTARDAFFRDFRVFFPADGNGSLTEEQHVGTLRNLAFAFAYVNTCEKVMSEL